jgi:hypothetical protein
LDKICRYGNEGKLDFYIDNERASFIHTASSLNELANLYDRINDIVAKQEAYIQQQVNLASKKKEIIEK